MLYKFCPECGKKLRMRKMWDEGEVPFCDGCDIAWYEHPAPCIITLAVNQFEEVALLRQDYIMENNYVLVAGYIKPGETAEETAFREVEEEIGVKLDSISRVRSFAIPEKELLMLGYVGFGDKVDLNLSTEVDSAVLVPAKEALEKLKGSEIAYRILEAYLEDPEGIRRSADEKRQFLPERE